MFVASRRSPLNIYDFISKGLRIESYTSCANGNVEWANKRGCASMASARGAGTNLETQPVLIALVLVDKFRVRGNLFGKFTGESLPLITWHESEFWSCQGV